MRPSAEDDAPGLDATHTYTSVVRQFIPIFDSAPSIVVVAQQWPCWLSTVLALRLPVIGGFFASRYHTYFDIPDTLKLTPSWSTVDTLSSHSLALEHATILASGSLAFLATVEAWLRSYTGPFIYAVDMCFLRHSLRDATRLYRSVACHKLREGYDANIVDHAAYGGGTNAVHLLLTTRLTRSIVAPPASLRRVVKHVVNAAARGGFVAISPPAPVGPDPPHGPIMVDGLGRMEGLFDVTGRDREYALPCVFKPTGWVRRRLTAVEWLSIHDVPVGMMEPLDRDALARQAIGAALSPLVVQTICVSLWGRVVGEDASAPKTYEPIPGSMSPAQPALAALDEPPIPRGVEPQRTKESLDAGKEEEMAVRLRVIRQQHNVGKAV